jgi:pimeloyl-ACP methyl ester carboxylesterase
MPPRASRSEITLDDGRRLVYTDFGGSGRPLIALHGHFSEGAAFEDLAQRLAPDWHVFAPDQRGHGDSDRASTYTRDGYIQDLAALISHLTVAPVVVLGHSMGGVNAVALAARRPALVSAFIAVEISTRDPGQMGLDILDQIGQLPYTASNPGDLIAAAGPFGAMIRPFLRRVPANGGEEETLWRLPFHPADTVASEVLLRTDHWEDWMSSQTPALLVRGRQSPVLSDDLAQTMIRRRPAPTSYAELDTDHFVHLNDPEGFGHEVGAFLRSLPGV